MIDSHTHLFLCDGPEAEVVAAASEAGVSRMLTVGMDAETNPAAIAAAERYEGVFAAVGRHPNQATGFDDGAQAEIARLGAHEKVRAIGETGLDYYRDSAAPGRSAPRLRGPDRDRPRARAADRDPRPRPRGRQRGDRRDLRHARRQGGRPHGDPPLLLGAAGGSPTRPSAAGTAPSPATSPTPGPRRCAWPRRRCPRTGSWSRPTRPTWPRRRCAASRNEPANVVATARRRRRGARRLLRGAGAHGRGQRPRPLRLVAALGPARPELPRRPQPARRDRPRRRPRRRTTWCWRSGPGRGADRAPRRGGAPASSTRSRSTAAWSRRWRRSGRPPQRQPALGRRDEASTWPGSSRRRRRWSPTCPTRWRRR